MSMFSHLNTKLFNLTFVLLVAMNVLAQEDIDNTQRFIWSYDKEEKQQIELLKEHLNSDSSNIQNWLTLGSLWENMLQLDSAAFAYSKALEIRDSCARCKQLLAGVKTSMGKVSMALKLYEEALSLDSANVILRSQYARLLKRDSRFREAYLHFQQLISNDSTNYYIWEQIGDCAMRIDSGSTAMLAYLNSFELNPANMPLALKLINGYIQAGTPPLWVFPYVDRAYKEDSTYVPLIRAKGYLHFLNKDFKKAEHWLSKAYDMGDSSKFNMKFLGISYYHNGNYLKSSDQLEKAYSIDSTDITMNFVYAKALNEVGERTKAIEVLNLTEDLITPCPDEMGLIYATRADAYRRGQQYAQSNQQYEKALKYTPDETEYYFQIAMNYYNAKEYLSARNAFNNYLSIINSNEEVYSRKAGYINHLLQRIEKELFFLDQQ